MGKSIEMAPLDWKEWDFKKDKLPDDELAACHAHEYGREVAKQCRYILTQLRIVCLANELPKKDKMLLSDARIEPPYKKIHPKWGRGSDARTKLDSFDIPWTLTFRDFHNRSWYSLPPGIRHEAVQIALYKKEFSKGKDLMCLSIHTIRELKPYGHTTMQFFQWRDENRRASDSKTGGRIYDRGAVEYGFFSINWNSGVGVLKEQFAEWVDLQLKVLKKGHPVGQRKPSRGQLRDQLRWLGALRIKEHCGYKNLADQNLPKLRVCAPYNNRNDLYENAAKASRKIVERIERILTPAQ